MYPLAVLSSQPATAQLSFPIPADSLTTPDAVVIDQPGASVHLLGDAKDANVAGGFGR
jgi:hypothetical protein